MDPNFRGLLAIVGILVVLTGIHNFALGEEDTFSWGYCDSFIYCAGLDAGFCLGVEQLEVKCYDPVTEYEEYRTVEIECLLQGSGLCKQGIENWSVQAKYNGIKCSEWAETDKRIDIIDCDLFFKDSTLFDQIK